jgi:hypothetical protein
MNSAGPKLAHGFSLSAQLALLAHAMTRGRARAGRRCRVHSRLGGTPSGGLEAEWSEI